MSKRDFPDNDDTCTHGTPPSERTVEISGSWGTLIVGAVTGQVKQLIDEPHDYGISEKTGKEEIGYRDIRRIDVVEWMKTYPGEEFNGGDILDFAFWYVPNWPEGDGTGSLAYQEPAHDWRNMIKATEGSL